MVREVTPVATLRRAALAGLLVALLAPAPAPAENGTPLWPSERDQRLRTVRTHMLGLQRRISAAVYQGRQDDAQQLIEHLNELRAEAKKLKSASESASAGGGARPIP